MIDAVRMMRAALTASFPSRRRGASASPSPWTPPSPAWWTPSMRPGRPGRPRPVGTYDAGVTTPLARDEPRALPAFRLGRSLAGVAGKILAEGIESRYDSLPVRELSLVTLVVDRPDPDDAIITHTHPGAAGLDAGQPPTRRGWPPWVGRTATPPGCSTMTARADQVAWVIDRLRQDPSSRSAAITTFQHAPTARTSRASACSTSGFRVGRWSWWPTATASTSGPRATAT